MEHIPKQSSICADTNLESCHR